ncbi:hypothetical protein D3C75_687460 [compost metagenome]
MAPHSAIGGFTPSPRKFKLEEIRIANPIPSVALTISGASALGRIWRNKITEFFKPIARPASTNSFSRRSMVCPYMSRTYSGMPTTLTAIMALVKPGPIEAAMAIASTKAGKAKNMSMTRMIMLPRAPP